MKISICIASVIAGAVLLAAIAVPEVSAAPCLLGCGGKGGLDIGGIVKGGLDIAGSAKGSAGGCASGSGGGCASGSGGASVDVSAGGSGGACFNPINAYQITHVGGNQ